MGQRYTEFNCDQSRWFSSLHYPIVDPNILGSQKLKGSAFACNWEYDVWKMWKLGKFKNAVDIWRTEKSDWQVIWKKHGYVGRGV